MKILRTVLGMEQGELARLAGVQQATVSKLERGKLRRGRAIKCHWNCPVAAPWGPRKHTTTNYPHKSSKLRNVEREREKRARMGTCVSSRTRARRESEGGEGGRRSRSGSG